MGKIYYNKGKPLGRTGHAVEKRRVRLEINGVVCGLITQESDEYMGALAEEVGELMREIQASSPYITREAAALTVALSFCDDARKNGGKAAQLQERVDELEVEAEIMQEEQAQKEQQAAEQQAQPDPALLERLQKLETENTALSEAAQQASAWKETAERLEDENAALRESAGKDTPSPELEQLNRQLQDAMAHSRSLESELQAEREQAETLQKKLERQQLEQQKPEPQKLERVEKAPAAAPAVKHRENPLRSTGMDDAHMVSFFAK